MVADYSALTNEQLQEELQRLAWVLDQTYLARKTILDLQAKRKAGVEAQGKVSTLTMIERDALRTELDKVDGSAKPVDQLPKDAA